jgi:hypothetical protein
MKSINNGKGLGGEQNSLDETEEEIDKVIKSA